MKTVVERVLVGSKIPTASRLARRHRVLILAYHNVVPTGVEIGGDSSLHLSQAQFGAQLDLLQDTHEILPLDAILTDTAGPGARPQAAITFDDAYRGAITVGVGELVARRLPATVFVPPAFIGGRSFWWDAATPSGAPGPPEWLRRFALEECRGMDDAIREWARRSGFSLSAVPSAAACASEDELRAAASQPGITLASHSWSHPNLTKLSPSELREELTRSMAWLGERFDNVVPVLSYPYGLASSAVERAAADAGYRGGILVTGGWSVRRPRNPFAVPRLNVPATVSRDGFLLRTAGLL